MYVCMYVCIDTYICMYVCMYRYICMYVYVCMYGVDFIDIEPINQNRL